MEEVKFSAKNVDHDKTVHIYTDGGCRSTAKKGETIKETDKSAYAYFLKQGGLEKIGGEATYGKTNNFMEIAAVIAGLKCLKRKDLPVKIYSDSAYVVNTIQNRWYVKWRNNGWDKKGGLANRELWIELIGLYESFPFITFEKVKGHNGIDGNEVVDSYLNKLMDELPNKEINQYA